MPRNLPPLKLIDPKKPNGSSQKERDLIAKRNYLIKNPHSILFFSEVIAELSHTSSPNRPMSLKKK
jgi:hypothetical protein